MDERTLQLLVIVGAFAAIIVVPIALVIVVVRVRASRRRARLREPWGELARRIHGQLREGSGFEGSMVYAARDTHSLRVAMKLVSVAEAMGVPYYPDGGTFTEIIAELPWQYPASFVPHGSRTQTFADPRRVPSLAQLGPGAEIFIDPKVARIVVPGVVEDVDKLTASARALDELTQLVFATGPLPVRAAA
jgi:hypothetical protein